MAGDYDLAFTDGSKLEDGKTGAGWAIRNQFYGGRGLGDTATVWDAGVTAIAETLRRSKGKRLLLLSDSKAAIAAVVKAGKKGRGRTRELIEAADLTAKRCRKDPEAVCLSWVKSHIGSKGTKQQMRLQKGQRKAQERQKITNTSRSLQKEEPGRKFRTNEGRNGNR